MSQVLQKQGSQKQALTERQFVVFILADELYGVDVDQVREITMVPEIIGVPGTPDFVEGIINLRGQMTTIVDLRKRFGLPKKKECDQNRIIIIEKEGTPIGMAIDRVTEVLRLPESSIEDTQDLVCDIALEYIKGVGKLTGGTLLVIVDLERVISKVEVECISTR